MGELAVIGAGGVLGVTLVEQALAGGADRVHAFTHGPVPAVAAATSERVLWRTLDIADAAAVWAALSAARPAVVINAAAMTNVDQCESRRERAYAANAAGPRHIAEACVRLGAAMLQISTDYVFAGDDPHPGPYTEDAAVAPINAYGRTKLEGERAVAALCDGRVRWLVVRTALVYGLVPGGRANFITWLVGELRAGRPVRVVGDQYNTPTLVGDLARVVLHLARHDTMDIVHVVGPELLSRHAWARQIAAYYGLDEALITQATTAELRQPAARPLQSGLRTLRGHELGGIALSGVRAGLEALGPL
jgi:dTDP-4-dehydrorhamnose reductase